MPERSDPFTDLRAPIAPVDPDPAFARRLRARVERALALPRGVVPVTATVAEPATAPTGPRPAAVPYLAVDRARQAIDWYIDVFGASVVGEPIEMPDGRIGHAELHVGDGVLYLADAHPDVGVAAPAPGAASVSLMLPVPDADEVRGRAINAGATGDRPPYDGYGERHAWIVDPFGHRWGLTSPLRDPAATAAHRRGDVVHVALLAPDVERTRAFYADVLGWNYRPDGRVDGSTPSIGFREGAVQVTCDYAVTDLTGALDAVRAAGGEAGEIERYPWGTVSECVDDQGTPFRLHEVPADPDGPAPPQNGNRPGDLSYLTLHVVDSAKARAFYGAVLGWTFTPGRIEDGWGVERIAPMTGLSGGNERGTGVPMWTVTDVHAAVERVRALGGTATDPAAQPYGLSSECVDDQGMRFYLGQA